MAFILWYIDFRSFLGWLYACFSAWLTMELLVDVGQELLDAAKLCYYRDYWVLKIPASNLQSMMPRRYASNFPAGSKLLIYTDWFLCAHLITPRWLRTELLEDGPFSRKSSMLQQAHAEFEQFSYCRWFLDSIFIDEYIQLRLSVILDFGFNWRQLKDAPMSRQAEYIDAQLAYWYAKMAIYTPDRWHCSFAWSFHASGACSLP